MMMCLFGLRTVFNVLCCLYVRYLFLVCVCICVRLLFRVYVYVCMNGCVCLCVCCLSYVICVPSLFMWCMLCCVVWCSTTLSCDVFCSIDFIFLSDTYLRLAFYFCLATLQFSYLLSNSSILSESICLIIYFLIGTFFSFSFSIFISFILFYFLIFYFIFFLFLCFVLLFCIVLFYFYFILFSFIFYVYFFNFLFFNLLIFSIFASANWRHGIFLRYTQLIIFIKFAIILFLWIDILSNLYI